MVGARIPLLLITEERTALVQVCFQNLVVFKAVEIKLMFNSRK
jgi:hypothetical protein